MNKAVITEILLMQRRSWQHGRKLVSLRGFSPLEIKTDENAS